MKRYRCQFCNFTVEVNKEKGLNSSKYIMGHHYHTKHKDLLPTDMSGYRYFYYLLTKKEKGSCVVCKQETEFNDLTMKYSRFCTNPQCKEIYRKERDDRMMRKYGKVYLLDDPDVQKQMQQNRRTAGKYLWSDGKTEISYLSSYEKHFLEFLDKRLNWPAGDIIGPSPNVYNYKHKGKSRFYIPDFFIPSLMLEVEIKSSVRMERQNPESREKELLKIDLMKSCKDKVNFIIIYDKQYEEFMKLIKELSEERG